MGTSEELWFGGITRGVLMTIKGLLGIVSQNWFFMPGTCVNLQGNLKNRTVAARRRTWFRAARQSPV
jgi:hypothetical protein